MNAIWLLKSCRIFAWLGTNHAQGSEYDGPSTLSPVSLDPIFTLKCVPQISQAMLDGRYLDRRIVSSHQPPRLSSN